MHHVDRIHHRAEAELQDALLLSAPELPVFFVGGVAALFAPFGQQVAVGGQGAVRRQRGHRRQVDDWRWGRLRLWRRRLRGVDDHRVERDRPGGAAAAAVAAVFQPVFDIAFAAAFVVEEAVALAPAVLAGALGGNTV